jgi:hypothetical protein
MHGNMNVKVLYYFMLLSIVCSALDIDKCTNTI